MSSTSATDLPRRRADRAAAAPGGEEPHLEHLRAEAPAVAVGAAQVHVAQELHLDVLEAAAAAGRAPAVARVEAEGARRVARARGRAARRRRACGSRRRRPT